MAKSTASPERAGGDASDAWRDAFLAAGAYGVAGAATAAVIVAGADGAGWGALVPAAGAAAALTGVGAHALMRQVGPESPDLRGLAAGALTGAASHPVAWYFGICAAWALGTRGSLGAPILDPVRGIGGAIVLSLPSLLLVAPVTVPVAALVGWLVGRASRAGVRRAS